MLGLALFAVGLSFIAVDVMPFFFDHHNTPLWLNLCCLAAPAGFAVAFWGGIRAGRAQHRQALAQVRAEHG